jgi:hypothetical protein
MSLERDCPQGTTVNAPSGESVRILPRRSSSLATVLVVVAILCVACGGSTASDSSPPPPATNPVATVELRLAAPTITVGQTSQATAALKDASGATLSGRAIAWSSANSAVASTDQGGLVTAVGVGTTTITAISEGKSGSVDVTVAAPLPVVPGAPAAPLATAGNRSASLTWAAPSSNGGSAVTGYSVLITPAVPSAVITVTGTSASITGLSNGTPYTFAVTATNAVGTGPASAASNAVTPEAPPTPPAPPAPPPPTATAPGAPTAVTATAGNQSVSLTWTAPASNGGSSITGYTVIVSPTAPPSVFNLSGASASVTGLANGTAYTFTVTATNAVGTGPASAASNAVTPVAPPGAPGAPTAVSAAAGVRSASLTWTAPASNGGSSITGYTVIVSPTAPSAVFNLSGASASVTGLANGAACTFTVTASNAVGTGPASAASNAVTPVVPPETLSVGPHILSLSVAVPPDLVIPVSGIAVTLTLPAGVTVATTAPGAPRIADAELSTGIAISGENIVTGTYVASSQQVKLSLAWAPGAPWSGEYLRLRFTVEPGAVVTDRDILQLKSTFAAYKAVGVDDVEHRTVVLTAQATTTLRVVAP